MCLKLNCDQADLPASVYTLSSFYILPVLGTRCILLNAMGDSYCQAEVVLLHGDFASAQYYYFLGKEEKFGRHRVSQLSSWLTHCRGSILILVFETAGHPISFTHSRHSWLLIFSW